MEARGRPGGVNLGLQRIDVSIWWQGKSGGCVKDVEKMIRTMLRYEDPPAIFILHIGGNDIGLIKGKELITQLIHLFHYIQQSMPSTMLVWSQILPRLAWRYSDNGDAMEKIRNRVNTAVASYLTKSKGCYIRYPDIKANSKMLLKDGVHLTTVGNNVFLNTLQGGLNKSLEI